LKLESVLPGFNSKFASKRSLYRYTEAGPDKCAAAAGGGACDPGPGLSARLWHAGWTVGYVPLDAPLTYPPYPSPPPTSPPEEGGGGGGGGKGGKGGGRGKGDKEDKSDKGGKGRGKGGGKGTTDIRIAATAPPSPAPPPPVPCGEEDVLSEEEKAFIVAAVSRAANGGGGGGGGDGIFGGGGGGGGGLFGGGGVKLACEAGGRGAAMVGSMAIHYSNQGEGGGSGELKAMLETLPRTRAEGRFEMLVNVDSASEHSMWLAAMGLDDWLAYSPNLNEIRGYQRLAQLASTEIVAMMRADDVPTDPKWLTHAASLFDTKPTMGLLGLFNGHMDDVDIFKKSNQVFGKKYGPVNFPLRWKDPTTQKFFMYMYKAGLYKANAVVV
jgi:hypothetical protein